MSVVSSILLFFDKNPFSTASIPATRMCLQNAEDRSSRSGEHAACESWHRKANIEWMAWPLGGLLSFTPPCDVFVRVSSPSRTVSHGSNLAAAARAGLAKPDSLWRHFQPKDAKGR